MESLYSLIHDFLKNRGIKPNDETSGSFSFSVNGLNFICDTNDKDPYFLRLTLPRINRPEALLAEMTEDIQRLNRMFKVAKIVKGADNFLWIYADTFIYSTDQVDLLLDRLLQAMTDMINSYFSIEKVKKDETGQTQQ